MKILVTGSAGFIGNEVCLRLLQAGHDVVGLDNLDPYYDVNLKKARLARIKDHPCFTEARISLADRQAVAALFAMHAFERVVNLAAQAGVRHSLDHPESYVDTNMVGFANILEGCRAVGTRHLLFASSSSVYGLNEKMPFSETDAVDHPMSLYAASKRANELMAHTYSHLFGLPATGLRFFSVYGPWGRPDMALFLFAEAISEGRPIDVFNEGKMSRSFTYIDDIVDGVLHVLDNVPKPCPEGDLQPNRSPTGPFRIFNIGNETSESLMTYIAELEKNLGREAVKNMLPMQPGDVPASVADTSALREAVAYRPTTPIAEGIKRFVDWYCDFYKA